MSWLPSISTSGSTIGTRPCFLAQRGIARQRVAVGLDAGAGRDVVADVDHRAPLGETRAELVVLLQARRAGRRGLRSRLRPGSRPAAAVPLSTLMPGMMPLSFITLVNGTPALVDWRMVSSYRIAPRDVLAQLRRGQQHLAIGATVLLGVGDADAVEALGDGVVGFVDRDDALARRRPWPGRFRQAVRCSCRGLGWRRKDRGL